MARPVVADTAEHLYADLAVAQPADEALGWPFLILLSGIAAVMGELPTIVRDTDQGPGWSIVLDPARAPGWALPWLAQFAGVTLTPGLTDAQHRDKITSPPAFQRGTPDAMRAAAGRYLTGTKMVALVERDGSPYRITVVTRLTETPDQPSVLAALMAQKPAGLILTYTASLGTTWSEATHTWDGAAVTWDGALTNPV